MQVGEIEERTQKVALDFWYTSQTEQEVQGTTRLIMKHIESGKLAVWTLSSKALDLKMSESHQASYEIEAPRVGAMQ